MHIFDHLFVLFVAIVYPVVGYISYKRLLTQIKSGAKVDRSTLYSRTKMVQWSLFALALLIWTLSDRAWPSLGFGLSLDGRFLLAAILTIAGVLFLLMQVRQVAGADTGKLKELSDQIGDLAPLIPRNGNELGRFYAVSVTAGIVEETLWRGYIIWYLSLFMPLWTAAVISAIGFGVAHAYQGFANVPKIVAVGGVFTGLYLLSGSLWLPMLLHAAVDILQGRGIYEVVRRIDSNQSPPDGGRMASAPAVNH